MIRIHETFETEEQAEAFRERYYASYHPMGYGTMIRVEPVIVDGKERWVASGSRSESCD